MATENEDFQKVQKEFAEQMQAMTETIRTAGQALQPKPAAPEVPDLRPEALDAMAKEKGIGAVMETVGRHVLAPMQADAYELAISTSRRMVEKDPDLGKWAKKHKAEIDAAIKADPRRAASDMDGIVQRLRDTDPDYQNEVVESRVAARLAEEEAKRKAEPVPGPYMTPAPRTPIDRPAPVATTAGPTPAVVVQPGTSARDAEIAAIQVTQEELDHFRRLVPNGTVKDIQEARHARLEAQRDPVQYNHQGGVPICTLDEIGQRGDWKGSQS